MFFYYSQMTKTTKTILLSALIALVAGCSGSDGEGQGEQSAYQSVDTVPMLIMQIQKCSRLYTTEMKIHKIVTHDDVVKLQGQLLKQNIDIKLPMGDRKVAIPIDATLKAYIDFSDFSERNIERTTDGKITILLPDPKVELTSSKVNQQEIRSFVGIVRSRFTDEEMTRYEQQGREAIIQSIPRLGIVDMAKASAARTLIPMVKQMGYREENITIAYRKDFKPFDIRKFLEVKSEK
jgi:hypothetical protein